jgi:hypothetical protein
VARRAAMMIAAGLALVLAACGAPAPIVVLRAAYGASCGQPSGNVTWAAEPACAGQAACDLLVAPVVLGDPAEGCGKDFEVVWACRTGAPGERRAYVPAETSNGAHVRLACDTPID